MLLSACLGRQLTGVWLSSEVDSSAGCWTRRSNTVMGFYAAQPSLKAFEMLWLPRTLVCMTALVCWSRICRLENRRNSRFAENTINALLSLDHNLLNREFENEELKKLPVVESPLFSERLKSILALGAACCPILSQAAPVFSREWQMSRLACWFPDGGKEDDATAADRQETLPYQLPVALFTRPRWPSFGSAWRFFNLPSW